jgi:signal transduction histidine kinase
LSRRSTPKRLLLLVAVCILAGTFFGLFSAQFLARQDYRSISSLLGAVGRVHPGLADTLVQELKEPRLSDYTAGEKLLAAYHYTPRTFWGQNVMELVGVSVLLMLALGALAGFLMLRIARRRTSRIEEITAYLEAVNLGRERILIRREDQFSHLEDELYKTVTELRQTRENALRQRQSLADHLADISHQLKTPITSMSLMTELLADGHSSEDRVYTDKLQRQINRLSHLVSSLLTLSKLDAGTLEFKKEPVDVTVMLTRAIEPIGAMLSLKRQRLIIEPELEGAFHYSGDILWSAEAFLNLIKNCSEHTPEDGILSIRCSQNPLYTEIIVKDSGHGFAREELPHIFERFYKGSHAAPDSIGIGLALTKAIIEKLNGTIRADNTPTGGAQFTVKFYV